MNPKEQQTRQPEEDDNPKIRKLESLFCKLQIKNSDLEDENEELRQTIQELNNDITQSTFSS